MSNCSALAYESARSAGQKLQANGLSFNVVDTGGSGEAVILLHGFPNDWSLWRHQVHALANAGFRAVAPDLRGYGDSDRPKSADDYKLSLLVKDVEGILNALSIRSAHVVGHDWGALLAWAFAAQVKDRTKSLTVISVAHPAGFFAGTAGFQQRKCSWYMLLFQYPGLAEKGLIPGGPIFTPMEPTEGALEDYKNMFERLARPETKAHAAAVTAGLNWYRANIDPAAFMTDKLMDVGHVATDTLAIWPTGDEAFLVEETIKASGKFVDPPGTFRYKRVECPTHFASWDAPDETTKLILEFLQAHNGSA